MSLGKPVGIQTHELKEIRMEVIYKKVKELHNKPGRAQRGSRGKALLFQDLGTRWGWVKLFIENKINIWKNHTIYFVS